MSSTLPLNDRLDSVSAHRTQGASRFWMPNTQTMLVDMDEGFGEWVRHWPSLSLGTFEHHVLGGTRSYVGASRRPTGKRLRTNITAAASLSIPSMTTLGVMTPWPVSSADLRSARERLKPFLSPTSARNYGVLDAKVGHDIEVWVKHENHQPTGSFKIRNGLSAATALDE